MVDLPNYDFCTSLLFPIAILQLASNQSLLETSASKPRTSSDVFCKLFSSYCNCSLYIFLFLGFSSPSDCRVFCSVCCCSFFTTGSFSLQVWSLCLLTLPLFILVVIHPLYLIHTNQ